MRTGIFCEQNKQTWLILWRLQWKQLQFRNGGFSFRLTPLHFSSSTYLNFCRMLNNETCFLILRSGPLLFVECFALALLLKSIESDSSLSFFCSSFRNANWWMNFSFDDKHNDYTHKFTHNSCHAWQLHWQNGSSWIVGCVHLITAVWYFFGWNEGMEGTWRLAQ